MTTLPQEQGPGQLPGRGDVLDLEMEGESPRTVTLLALDTELDVWTARDAVSGELLFIRISDDLTWQHVIFEDAT